MTRDNSTPSPTPDKPGETSPPPRLPRRRRRKWLIAIGVIVVLLLLLVALAPTLVGTAPVRSFIVGRVNGSIPGKVQLDDLSLGWLSGIHFEGLKLYDENNALILEVPRFKTDLTLLKAVRGDLALGNTTADVNVTRCVVDENGVTNYQRALGLAEEKPAEKPAEKKPAPSEPSRLPDISGSFAINILGGTIEMPGRLPQSVHLQPGSIKAHIPNINQPINNSADIGYRLGDAAPGTLRLNGNLDIADNNVLTLEKLKGAEDIVLETINLAPIAGFLPPEQAMKLAGTANGGLQLKADGLDDASVNGKIILTDLLVGGKPLNGDTYRSASVGLPVAISMKGGAGGSTILTIQRLAVESEEINLDITGSAGRAALENLAALKPPGSEGKLALSLKIPELQNVAGQLPNTLHLGPDVRFTGGSLTSNANLTLRPDAAVASYDLNASAQGTRGGKPIQLEPITLKAGATAIPTGLAVPKVQDVAVDLTSAFATLKGGGQSLEKLNFNGQFDLARLRQQAAQFSDLGDTQLSGTGTLAITTEGDPTQAGQPLKARANVTLNDVHVSGLKDRPPIEQPWLALDASADVAMTQDYSVSRIPNATLTLQNGQPKSPNVDLAATVKDFDPNGTAPMTFVLSKLNINDLPAAQRQFGAFIPALQDNHLQIASGQLYSTTEGTGTFGEAMHLSLTRPFELSIRNLTLNKLDEANQPRPILSEENLKAVLTAKMPDASRLVAQGQIDSAFATLKLDNAALVLGGGEPGAATQPSAFDMLDALKLSVDAPDLARLYALAGAFSPPAPTTAPAPAPANGEAPPEPVPPLEIDKGGATVVLDLQRQSGVTKVKQADATITGLAFHRGDAAYQFAKPITIKTLAELDAAEALRGVRVDQLNADLGSIATVSLAEPLYISDLQNDVPTARGTLNVDGQIRQLGAMLEALQGSKDAYPYAGQLAMTEKLATDPAGKITLSGQLKATDFAVLGAGSDQPAFTEKELTLAQDVVVDPKAKDAVIKSLKLDMPSSQALQASATGAVRDWETARRFDNVKLDLAYDLEKLWPVIKPLMGPEMQEDLSELKIAGKAQRSFIVSGSLPARDAAGKALAFNESIKSLQASGGINVALFDFKGINIQALELPITLRDGQLMTIYADKKGAERLPKPAACNGGTLNIGGVVVDLSSPTPLLSIGKKQQVLSKVTMNPLFADSVLGKFINPTFVKPDHARGLIDVTVVQCERVPMGELIQQAGGANQGQAEFLLSITEMNIGNKFINEVVTALKPNAFNNNAIQGNIKDARLTIANGKLTEDLAIALDKYALQFKGGVRLSDQALLPLNLIVPADLLGQVDEQILKYLPQGFTVPIGGTTAAPKLDWRPVLKEVAAAATKAKLGQLIGGDEKKPSPGESGAASRPAEPEQKVGDLLEGLIRGATKEKKK